MKVLVHMKWLFQGFLKKKKTHLMGSLERFLLKAVQRLKYFLYVCPTQVRNWLCLKSSIC